MISKKFDLSDLFQKAQQTFLRFPFSILSAIIGSIIYIYLIEYGWDLWSGDNQHLFHLFKVVMCCSLGGVLFLSITLYSESKNFSKTLEYILHFIGIGLLIAYYFYLPNSFDNMKISEIVRYVQWSLTLHLLVSFSPFLANGNIYAFWNFNQILFFRFILAIFYSWILCLGLYIAMLVIDILLINFKEVRYSQLWVLIMGIYGPWFFLAGVPRNFVELESKRDYPKQLKVFTQFVLLPLVGIYLLILYAYGIKSVIFLKFPVVWIGWLVNIFSVLGILSFLLIWPVGNEPKNRWINALSRNFYIALLPLIVLLGIAIGKRIYQYGITENRYFVVLIALWLTGVSLYFLISKAKNIKVIPISLFIVLMLSSFGPWGASYISKNSQINRLQKLLEKENLFVNGKVKRIKDFSVIPTESKDQIASIVRYLNNYYGPHSIHSWFSINNNDADNIVQFDEFLEWLEIAPRDNHKEETKYKYYCSNRDWSTSKWIIDISNFDFLYYFDYYPSFSSSIGNNFSDTIYLNKDTLTIQVQQGGKWVFYKNGRNILNFDIQIFTRKILDDAKKEKDSSCTDEVNDCIVHLPDDKMIFDIQNDFIKVRFRIQNINLYVIKRDNKQDKPKITVEDGIDSINGIMLLKLF